MHRLAILEDEDQTRSYLRRVIETSGAFSVVADFGDAESAMSWFGTSESLDVDIVLCDIQLPSKSGIDFIGWMKERRPATCCMVLSSYDDADRVFKAIKAGAVGYVLKGAAVPALLGALHDLMAGGSPMSSQIARKVVNAFMDVPYHDPVADLSAREQEVLRWLAKGYSYSEIADKVFLSIDTVRTHIRNIYRKLQVRNKHEAIRKARLD